MASTCRSRPVTDLRWPACIAVTALLAGCATTPAPKAALYTQLGGEPGVAALVDAFMVNLADDDRIIDFFAGANVSRLRRLLEEKFCVVSDGPCTYTGGTMEESHRGMGIRDTEFNALVEDLIDAMDAQRLPVATQNRLLARLARYHKDIVRTVPPESSVVLLDTPAITTAGKP